MTRKPWRVDFDALKRQPFETIAAAWGYTRDTKASTPANPVLSAPGKPKLVTRRFANGHWVYFNTLDADDNGTIIDFMLSQGLSLADIAQRFAPADRADFHKADFRTRWNKATPHNAPPCLISRGIARDTLAAYQPLIRCDHEGRALCAHRNARRALTGFEISPPDGKRRFATGGTRSLFALVAAPGDTLTTLVITEGAVNAISLAQIDHCPADHAFLSTAGAPGAAQCKQIHLAAHRLPNLSRIILAQDADNAGDRQAGLIRKKVELPARVSFLRRRPPDNTDWNDIVNNP